MAHAGAPQRAAPRAGAAAAASARGSRRRRPCRPVTPSRRNEKNRDASSTVHQLPPLTRLHAGARQPVARQRRQVGQPARRAVRARGDEAPRRRRVRRLRRRPASTSAPTSKRRGPMHGAEPGRELAPARSAPPSHSARQRRLDARRRPGRASRHAPRRRPRPSGAANSTGRQSATCTVQATPGSVGHAGIGLRRLGRGQRRRRRSTTAQPCTWRSQTGRAPIGAAKRRRFSATAAGIVADRRAQVQAVARRRADAAGARAHQRADARRDVPLRPQHAGRSAAAGSDGIRAGRGLGLREGVAAAMQASKTRITVRHVVERGSRSAGR